MAAAKKLPPFMKKTAKSGADDPIPTSKTNKATKGAVAKKAGGSKK